MVLIDAETTDTKQSVIPGAGLARTWKIHPRLEHRRTLTKIRALTPDRYVVAKEAVNLKGLDPNATF